MGAPVQCNWTRDRHGLKGEQMSLRRWPDSLRLRARSLLRKGQVERELEKELRFHLDQEMEEAQKQGLSIEDAGLAARKKTRRNVTNSGGMQGHAADEFH